MAPAAANFNRLVIRCFFEQTQTQCQSVTSSVFTINIQQVELMLQGSKQTIGSVPGGHVAQ